MAYNLFSNNGNVTVNAETVNTSAAPIALVGKNAINWGDDYAQNFLSLVENFAGPTAPANPRKGILWWDTSVGVLKVYNSSNAWSSVSQQAASADKLTTARTIAISGAVSGSGSFDGSANVSIAVSLPTTLGGASGSQNNAPGFYSSPAFTVNEKGIITGITNNGGDGGGPAQYVSSFNNRGGNVNLTSQDVTDALGYTPTQNALTSINSTQVTDALGYIPANDSLVVHKAGDTMSGTLNMNGNRITGLPEANGGDQPVRKNEYDYLSSVVNQKTIRSFNGGASTSYAVTVSPNAPSGGNEGDVWFRY
jgi:hypothetical protein